MKKRINIILVSLILLTACSTKKNTSLSRTYHNLTAHYNAYFNGKESYKEGMKALKEGLNDNYSNILNVFIYDDLGTSSIGSQMQRAEEKATKVIKKHSITVKPKRKPGRKTAKEKAFYERKEYNNWVDDSYLLMGKAYFIEKNYFAAIDNFTWIITEYPKMNSRYEALIWLARCYIQKREYSTALDYLQRAEAEKDFPEKKLNKELFATYADLYLKQKKYPEAIKWLEMTLKEKPKKFYRRRYKFIMAQIYQRQGETKKASELFKEVIKMRPNYNMEFSAKINRAMLFDQGAGNSKDLRKELLKMAHDEKNKEFRDQIYYALANIDFKENKEEAAINNYKKSVENSVSNDAQKSLSCYALAKIYFNKLDYPKAKAYYDTTFMHISNQHEEYDKIKDISENLNILIGHINTIHLQDSLLQLAKLPPKQRDAVIAEIIEQILEKEREEAEERRQHQLNMAEYNENNRPGMNNNSGGKWYFYNPASIAMGQADFIRKWGERKLEDNWRRKNKSFVESDDSEGLTADGSGKNGGKSKTADKKSKQYYLDQLPLSDSAKVVCNETIESSMYKLAQTYRSKFVNYDKAIESYLALLDRYPNTELKINTYYELYQLYKLQKDEANTQKYKNLILNQFPESTPAKMISDPNYFAKMEAIKNKSKNLYSKALTAFRKRHYSQAIQMCEQAEDKQKNSPLIPKFKLLKAQSIGAMGNVDEMKKELTAIQTKYPDASEKEMADFILERIEKQGYKNFTPSNGATYIAAKKRREAEAKNNLSGQTDLADNTEEDNSSIYQYEPQTAHDYIMVAKGTISDLNRLKFNIIKYNLDHFLMFDFKISDRKLDSQTMLIIVKPLNDAKEAGKYLKLIQRNKQVYSEFNSLDMQQLIISTKNLEILLKDKDINRYSLFFKQNYK